MARVKRIAGRSSRHGCQAIRREMARASATSGCSGAGLVSLGPVGMSEAVSWMPSTARTRHPSVNGQNTADSSEILDYSRSPCRSKICDNNSLSDPCRVVSELNTCAEIHSTLPQQSVLHVFPLRSELVREQGFIREQARSYRTMTSPPRSNQT